MSDKTRVSRAALEQIETVRASGLVNMLDRPAAIRLARSVHLRSMVEFMEANPYGYTELIMYGPANFEILDEEGQTT